MNGPSFEIHVLENAIELKADGELTSNNERVFRLQLLKLLQQERSKSFKLNLRQASAIDSSCIRLIYILKRQLTAVRASIVIEMPESLDKKIFDFKTDFLNP